MGSDHEKTCAACGGSGQISFFKGVSRFLISWEECPECGGLGFITEPKKKEDKKKKRDK
ncbi:MAG: hypothetical protein ABFS09_09740 [Thermodesulfobacteriota bacterium]